MQPHSTSDQPPAATPPGPRPISTPDFSGAPLSIEDVAGRPDFPQCVLGVYIDIRGFAGVVVDIVNQSIKVRSPEGTTQSFNAYRLKTLFAPPERYEPPTPTRETERPDPPAPAKPVAPPRVYIADPDFTAPVRPISDYAGQPDFPQCAYGKHVDIVGFSGVVVEIVKGSLKVQPPVGGTRSYNAEIMRKLYGKR